jgi:hypothetical protein
MMIKLGPVIIHIHMPPERGVVTFAVFALAVGMLFMAREDPKLWDIELFKIILQAVIISGILNMVLAFHFTANKADEAKTENTAKAFEAIGAVAANATAQQASSDANVAAGQAADKVADAAVEQANAINGDQPEGMNK